MSDPTPLVVLGGSDRKAALLPPTGRDKHPLTGCKGVDIRIGGRCMVDLLVERLADSGYFEPIYIAGPAEAYRASAHPPERIIDTDGGFGRNIQVGLETAQRLHPGRPLAMSTCDILPEPRELERVWGDYRRSAPCDMWFPFIACPEDPQLLGEFSWKPRYRVIPEAGTPAVSILPSHLVVFDPDAMRLRFIYRIFDLAYRSRNRPIGYRRSFMLRRLLLSMLLQDLRLLFRLRPPTLTWDITHSGLSAARKLKAHVVTRTELEDALRRMFVKRSHRKRHPERRIQFPILDAMSLARDIDTREEAISVGGTVPVHP